MLKGEKQRGMICVCPLVTMGMLKSSDDMDLFPGEFNLWVSNLKILQLFFFFSLLLLLIPNPLPKIETRLATAADSSNQMMVGNDQGTPRWTMHEPFSGVS